MHSVDVLHAYEHISKVRLYSLRLAAYYCAMCQDLQDTLGEKTRRLLLAAFSGWDSWKSLRCVPYVWSTLPPCTFYLHVCRGNVMPVYRCSIDA